MKKFLTVIFLCLVIFTNTSAQDYKNDIGFTYSTFTIPQFVYVFGGVLGAAFTLGHFTFDNTIMTGNFGVEYNRWTNNWFGWGASVFGEAMTADAYNVDSDGNRIPNGKYNMSVVSVVPMIRLRWFNHPHFGMYSKLGAGPGLVFSGEASLIPSVQISPVCMEFGGDSWRGLIEIGVGMQGIITAGVKKSF